MSAAEVTPSPRTRPVFSRLIEPRSYLERLDLGNIFGRNAPIHVDLGCGEGAFLLQMAMQEPDKNFLGVERMLGRTHSTARKAEKIENLRVLRMESSYAVRYLLPPGSVEQFYLLFPDPWPKRRHQRRRVVTDDFLNAIHDALEDQGKLLVATDQLDYFEQIKQLAADRTDFVTRPADDVDLPRSKFEAKFQKQRVPIYRFELRKVSPVK